MHACSVVEPDPRLADDLLCRDVRNWVADGGDVAGNEQIDCAGEPAGRANIEALNRLNPGVTGLEVVPKHRADGGGCRRLRALNA